MAKKDDRQSQECQFLLRFKPGMAELQPSGERRRLVYSWQLLNLPVYDTAQQCQLLNISKGLSQKRACMPEKKAEPIPAPVLGSAARFPYGPFQFKTEVASDVPYEIQGNFTRI